MDIVEYSTSYSDCSSQLGMAYTPCACNSFFMADGNPAYNYWIWSVGVDLPIRNGFCCEYYKSDGFVQTEKVVLVK